MDLVENNLSAAAIGVLSIIVLCFVLFQRSKSNKGREAPMVEGAWPILGHLPLLSGSKATHHILGDMADRYGPVYTIKLGLARVLVINNSEMAKECFTTNDLALSQRPKLLMVQNMTYNQAMFGMAPYGAYWREMRRIVNSSFLSSHKVDLLSHIHVSQVKTSIKDLFDFWSRNKDSSNFVSVEMKQWLRELAFNTTLKMLVGKQYSEETTSTNDKESEKCLSTLREYMRLVGVVTIADAIPFLRWFDFGGHEKAMKKTFKEVDSVVGGWLEEHRKKRTLAYGKVQSDRDFIDAMLSIIDGSTIEGIDADTIIKATTTALSLGATDTSSAIHIWGICLLLNNPHALEKVKEEIDTHIGNKRFVTESDINNLTYLQAVVKETIRLYPPTPIFVREFGEDCTVGGYYVKKGTRLFTNVWKIQTDPIMWHDPLEFKPERFLMNKEVDVRGHNFEFIAFGSGRRVCPGITFGLKTAYLTLASFLSAFEISKPSSEPIDMSAVTETTNIKVTPLEILIKPRLSLDIYETM
ncbi:hypothetical protein Lal_00036803 [Lupinus albus]|uniref:Putative cytochrome P450 n=1 Tax=Lupinus albus TaxID=3870 RepID=A0A6A4PU87_LUPAL|nr:putative cytochrome P450 [Lupinus albus]KAF1888761.1 hypothetical protein Lal_00036803 [Lupinus albus]